MTFDELFSKAVSACENSYSPYSGFRVGAALLCSDGSVYTGVNIENSSFPVTLCAERTAFAKAVSEGKREFTAIAVYGRSSADESPSFCPPCGMCRQFMSEFCNDSFVILISAQNGGFTQTSLGEILPCNFKLK